MARYIGPVCRLCRSAGMKLYLKGSKCYTPKCCVTKRNTKPGMHPARTKVSEYALQLKEKQKAKQIYGILESQFYNYFKEAEAKQGLTGEQLLQLIERRLDNVVFRLGFAESRSQARQLVRHGHIIVGNRRVDIPSYKVKKDQIITLDESGKNIPNMKERAKRAVVPKWLHFDREALKGTVASYPLRDDIDYELNEKLIVEFYSR